MDQAETAGLAEAGALAGRFEEESSRVADRAAWEDLRLRWVGRKQGIVRTLLARTGEVPAADRRAWGQAVNTLKERVEGRLAELDAVLTEREREAVKRSAAVDVTLPGRRPLVGSLHPITRVNREMERIFAELGYSVAEGPEVETDYHNFEALNFPQDHPARDTQDTLFLKSGFLLRTHTSPVQIRTMLARKPPIRVICPGRVFRNDNDLRHSPMFHQVEGLAVAEGLTVGHLKGTLLAFLRRLFAPDVEIRLRPSFFPFTEPSAEVDVTCQSCKGQGCAVCSGTGWMEILGCGMVDPRVLDECGIDPDRYSGYAFGMGVDRVAMNRYGIANIRLLFDNDERLLRQVHG
ncbi:MAG TPA: phenylalanine--tRNA ligase subunit alpha [Acidobacteria bacterium]|nr:phenylalanine--tRNA ligase subunit alpha [Acidobacteriota bacterium]